MRAIVTIGRLLGRLDTLLAVGLLSAALLVSPPRDGGAGLAVAMIGAIRLTAAALHALRTWSTPGSRLDRLGSWTRATVALGVSASVLMIVDATVAAIG